MGCCSTVHHPGIRPLNCHLIAGCDEGCWILGARRHVRRGPEGVLGWRKGRVHLWRRHRRRAPLLGRGHNPLLLRGGGGRGSLGAGPRVVANPGTARLDLLLLLVMLAASSLLVASPAAAVTAAAGTAAPSFAFAALGLVKGPCLVLVIE